MKDFSLEETKNKFKEKCVVDSKTKEDWDKCISYINEYSLEYEVFLSASHSYKDNMTQQQAVDAICIAMMDWDL